jgi:hypothetical protein
MKLFSLAEVLTGVSRAAAATLHGGQWSQKLLITEFNGIQYATQVRPPPHQASSLPLVDQSALPDAMATPPQNHCKSCQTPLVTDGSLARKIIINNWHPHKFCRACVSRNKISRKQLQEEKAALESRLEALRAESLAAAAAGARPEHAGEAASTGGAPVAALSTPDTCTRTRTAIRPGSAPATAPRPSEAHPPPPANVSEGGEDNALSVLGVGDVFSCFDHDPAKNDEGHQLLAASRRARRRAGNHKREAARAQLAGQYNALQLVDMAMRDPAACDQHFDSIGASRARAAEKAAFYELERLQDMLGQVSHDNVGTDTEESLVSAAEHIRELLDRHNRDSRDETNFPKRLKDLLRDNGVTRVGTEEANVRGLCLARLNELGLSSDFKVAFSKPWRAHGSLGF